jgi:hypothetical protein
VIVVGSAGADAVVRSPRDWLMAVPIVGLSLNPNQSQVLASMGSRAMNS